MNGPMLDPLHDQLPARIARRLTAPLPGRNAHRRMVSELAYGRHAGPPAWDVRPAAVLACLYPHGGRWHIPLTLRPADMVDHAGQVSLPGGMNEPGETAEACALREYEEELGDKGERLTILGRLTPLYVPPSNFMVTPCLAAAPTPPRLTPNPREVERVLTLPLDALLDVSYRGTHVLSRERQSFGTRHIRCGDVLVWGATAMILAEIGDVIVEVLRAEGGSDVGR